jgi:hypothetical protein
MAAASIPSDFGSLAGADEVAEEAAGLAGLGTFKPRTPIATAARTAAPASRILIRDMVMKRRGKLQSLHAMGV